MAREWALRGLSEEELKPSPKIESPQTPKGKFENYWYHYKWHTIGGVLLSIVLTVMIWQLATRDNPDYRLAIVTNGYMSDAAREKIETTFQKYGRDIDGDGKTEVSAEVLTLGADGQYAMANRTKFIAYLSAGDVMFFAFDKQTYESDVLTLEKEGFKFFDKLGIEADGVEEQGRYWNWKDSALRKDKVMEGTPEDMYFGVRSVSGTSENKSSKKMHDQCLELLKAFLTGATQDNGTK